MTSVTSDKLVSGTSAWRGRGITSARRAAPNLFLGRMALRYRIWLLACGHLCVFAFAYWLAFGLRFDFLIPPNMWSRMLASAPTVLAIKLIVFYFMGHYHGWWRYVTFADLTSLLRASLLALLVFVLVNHYVFAGQIPRSVVIMDSLMTALILGTLRASWRLYREHGVFSHRARRLALMLGADERSGLLAHQIHAHTEIPYRIIGFLDQTESRVGSRLGGIPILGTIDRLKSMAATYHAADVLLPAHTIEGAQLRRVMDVCKESQLNLKVIPSFVDHLSSDAPLPIRDVEINDLLPRDPIELDMHRISTDLRHRVILVTGAGGSIGSEICRQVLAFNPSHLILVDNGENNLFMALRDISQRSTDTGIHSYVVDVLDQMRLRQVFEKWRPDYVIHAAAHKHVGLMESNVAQCVRNNVLGTKSVADLANEFGTAKFVLISTDKAVNPTSVMGASKQVAERYVHALAQESKTAFVVVRFGNVLGSNGSVVPIFKEQIRQGGPITITDARMTRFFMTIPEASQLVLQAAAMGRGGEIFVLEMGHQIPVIDLARDLVRLSGLPTDSIEIRHVGMRPGEKLYEELYFEDERMLPTGHPKVRAAHHRPETPGEVRQAIEILRNAVRGSDLDVRIVLQQLVPNFRSLSGSVVVDDLAVSRSIGELDGKVG